MEVVWPYRPRRRNLDQNAIHEALCSQGWPPCSASIAPEVPVCESCSPLCAISPSSPRPAKSLPAGLGVCNRLWRREQRRLLQPKRILSSQSPIEASALRLGAVSPRARRVERPESLIAPTCLLAKFGVAPRTILRHSEI